MSIDATLLLRARPPALASTRSVTVHVAPVTEPSATYYDEDWGLRPAWSVRMRLDKHDLPGAQDALARLVGAALRGTAGDALLLWNGELPVLRRRADGAVTLTDRTPLWTPARAEALGLAVVRTDLGPVR
jgi:hypothetical protein